MSTRTSGAGVSDEQFSDDERKSRDAARKSLADIWTGTTYTSGRKSGTAISPVEISAIPVYSESSNQDKPSEDGKPVLVPKKPNVEVLLFVLLGLLPLYAQSGLILAAHARERQTETEPKEINRELYLAAVVGITTAVVFTLWGVVEFFNSHELEVKQQWFKLSTVLLMVWTIMLSAWSVNQTTNGEVYTSGWSFSVILSVLLFVGGVFVFRKKTSREKLTQNK